MNSPEKEKKEQEIYDSFFAESDHLKTLRPKPKQEWSDEDEVNKTRILESLEDQIRNADGVYYTKRLRTAQNWLKSLSSDLKKKNEDVAKLCSNEWSKEDEDAINGAIGILLDDNNPTFVFPEHSKLSVGEIVKRLKSLRPPFKDRDMKLKILKYLSTRCSSLEFEEVEDYLNNLRPHWKPSEDEERLIKTSISFLKDFADKGYENAVECIDWLKSKLNGNSC